MSWKKSEFSIGAILMQVIVISAGITEKQYALMPTLFHLDDYDKCMLSGDSIYCTITLLLHPINSENISEVWKIIEETNSIPTNYRHDLLRHGVCISETTNSNVTTSLYKNYTVIRRKLSNFYDEKYKDMGIGGEIIKIRAENKESVYQIDIYDTVFAVIAFLYVLTIAATTILDEIETHKTDKSEKITYSRKLILALSIRANWNRLFNIDLSRQDMQALVCIQGVRFYGMLWIIIVHTVVFVLRGFVSNPQSVENEFNSGFIMVIGDPTYPIQLFFMISGFLLTYNFFLELEKSERIKLNYLVRLFIKRYFRLTPVLAFLVAFSSTWMIHLSRGPLWEDFVGEEYRRCRENWWTNLLYINNYINENRMCLLHGWYLTVNMQLYVISLFLLCLIWRFQKTIIFILTSLLLIHIIAVFLVIYWNNYNYSMLLTAEYYYMDNILNSPEFHMVYAANFGNCAAVVVGIGYGYAFYKYRTKEFFKNNVSIAAWWILTWSISLSIVLLPVIFTIDPQLTPLFNVIYGSLRKAVFIVSSGMIIFGMTQGQGWLLKKACEGAPMYVLGRLTYCAYLIHFQLLRGQAGIRRSPEYFSLNVFIFETVQTSGLAFLGAFCLTLFIELPISELSKLMLEK